MGINTGIIHNAEPLSTESVKDLEKQVLENQESFAYLNENNELCFALPFDPSLIKYLAWDNAYELSTEGTGFTKKAYKKTGLETFYLDKVLSKSNINDSWGEPEPLEGTGQEFHTTAPSTLSFRSTAPLSELQEVQVNGETVDPSNYELEEGSTIVKLKHDYLSTLAAGKYEVAIVSDSKTVKGDFTVTNNAGSDSKFYYNRVYYASFEAGFDFVEVAVIFTEDGVVHMFDLASEAVFSGSYSFENNTIAFGVQSSSIWGDSAPFSGSFSDDGKVLSGTVLVNSWFGEEEKEVQFSVDTNIIYDGIYIYRMSSDQSYWSYFAIDKSLSAYPAPKNNIYGVDVTHLPCTAFTGCINLTSIELGDNINYIDTYCESSYLAGLTSINVSDKNVTYKTLDGNLYSKDGKTLVLYAKGKTETSFTVPEGVETIDRYAFYNSSRLNSITLGNHVTRIESDAFTGTGFYSNASNWENNILYLGKFLIAAKTNISGGISIKEGTEVIAGAAFYRCESLTSITIPDSMKIIHETAFSQCSGLADIHISDMMMWVNLNSANSNSYFLGHAYDLYLNGSLITELVIPAGVARIRNYAFAYCTSITSVTIPNSVVCLSDLAFYKCSSLTSIMIPDSVVSIGDSVFRDCTSLDGITIPDSVTSIGGLAFNGCTSLANIVIPDGATSIGDSAFYNTAYYNNSNNWEDGVFYVGKVLVKAKSSVPESYEIKPGTIRIAGFAFQNCSGLKNISIPDSVLSIGEAAFNGCSGLSTIELGVNVHSVGHWAFSDCSNLMNIIVPEENATYKTIDGSLYTHDAKILVCYAPGRAKTKVVISEGVQHIADYAFYCCRNLPDIVIPDSVKTIGDNAFVLCSRLKSLELGHGITDIGYCAFYLCEGLEKVVIKANVTSIDDMAFQNCGNLKSIDFTGTCKQWFMIKKGSMWYGGSAAYVQCTDGQVTL